MKIRLSLLALVAGLGISLTAQASDISYNVTGGVLSPSGSFSGSFLINSSTALIDGGTFTLTAPGGGTVYSFVNTSNDSPVPGLAFFTDGSADTFRFAINGNGGFFALNTLAGFGTGGDTMFTTAGGVRYDATAGTLTPTPTPEPSSLILLGTGALGLVGSFRRRFLNA